MKLFLTAIVSSTVCTIHFIRTWSSVIRGVEVRFTMMPGDTQSSAVAIAAEASVGDCQNCSVLHQVRPTMRVDYNVGFQLFE